MAPTGMVADRPLRPCMASAGRPHSGAMRGNSRNSVTMMGAPASAIHSALAAARRSGGLPTGMWLSTRAVSRPSMPISMAAATGRLCEKKKLLSRVKKPRKKSTKVSRRACISSVFRLSSTTTKATPASRPSKLPYCT